MFLKFSRVLPQFAPVTNAISVYFVFRHLRQIFYPGHPAPSLREFFYSSGCISHLDTYAEVLQGTSMQTVSLSPALQPKARWIYTPSNACRAVVTWCFTPSSEQACQGFITVDFGDVVEIQGHKSMDRGSVGVVVVKSRNAAAVGNKGLLPCFCISRHNLGAWHVEYCDAATRCLPCSSGSGIDIACAATMRACSSGFTIALVLRLGCNLSDAAFWDRKMFFKMNRLILAWVAAARSSCVIKVRAPCHL